MLEIFKNHQNFFDPKNLPKDSKKFDRDLILDDILNQLTYFCLPDAVHTTNEDSQFFFIQNYQTILYGISCYRQIKTNSLEVDDQNTRDCVQKAMCIVSKVPLFAHFHSKLSSTMTAFFNQNTLKDKVILEELYANYESISFKNLNINEIFMSFSLRKLFMFCKEKIFAILKLILLENKIIVYSNKSNNVCSFIISIVVNIGMWFERFVIIVTSLYRDYLPSSWSVYYSPSIWEIGFYMGTFGLFFTCFFLFAKYFPVIAVAEIKYVLKRSGESYKPEFEKLEAQPLDKFIHDNTHAH